MEIFTLGFSQALTIDALYYCFLGVLVGTAVGVLPGLGAIAAMSLLFPLTFHLEPLSGLAMLAGIYYGAEYGGSTASILLNLPGTPSSAVTAIDGYQLNKQGRAGVALFVATAASFVGGSIGIIAMMFLSGPIAALGLAFGSPEYFAIVVFGLVASATVGSDTPSRGLVMLAIGVVLGCVGIDPTTGATRFTLGAVELVNGINMVALVMGLFGIGTVVMSAGSSDHAQVSRRISLRSMVPSGDEVRRGILPTLRGSIAGSIVGVLPGTGTTMASFLGYGIERRVGSSKVPLGSGAVEGVAAPEAANNAASQTAFIPTLTLGVPGSASMAIIFGALLIHGITPGPLMISQRPEIFWGLVASFWIGNLLLLVLNIPLIGVWVRILSLPYRFLFPVVITLVCVGTYSIQNSAFDLWLALFFGGLGVILMMLHFQPAPLLLGFILGPLAEVHFRNTMSLSRGDILGLFGTPVATTFLIATLVMVVVLMVPRSKTASSHQ